MSSRALAFWACVLASGAAACGTTVEYIPLNNAPRPLEPRPPSSVEIFTMAPPPRHFVEIGAIEARQQGYSVDQTPDIYAKMREEAGARGCDGLVIVASNDAIAVSGYSSNGVGSISSRTLKGYRATCIVYTDVERGADHGASAPQPMLPPKGVSPCEAAYARVGEMAKLWARSHPEREIAVAQRAPFLEVCGGLSDGLQLCLSMPYYTTHQAGCDADFHALPTRTQDKVDGLFLEPEREPQGAF